MTEPSDPKSVGYRIREIRKRSGLSMAGFAAKIDNKAKSGTISNWETGKNLPNNERLKRIAELGGISVDELLYGSIDEIILNTTNESLEDFISLSADDIIEINKLVKEEIYDFSYKASDIDALKETIREILGEYIMDYMDNDKGLIKGVLSRIDTLKNEYVYRRYFKDVETKETEIIYNYYFLWFQETPVFETSLRDGMNKDIFDEIDAILADSKRAIAELYKKRFGVLEDSIGDEIDRKKEIINNVVVELFNQLDKEMQTDQNKDLIDMYVKDNARNIIFSDDTLSSSVNYEIKNLKKVVAKFDYNELIQILNKKQDFKPKIKKMF